MIDVIAVVRPPYLAGLEFGGGKLPQKRVQPPPRRKDVLEVQPGPAQLLGVFGECADDGILNVRIADEAGVTGKVAASGPQFVVECAVPGPLGSKLQGEEADIAGCPVLSCGQNDPLVAKPLEPARHPCPGHEILSFGIRLIDRIPIASQLSESIEAIDDIHTHGVDLCSKSVGKRRWSRY
ncbi:hypothetical protein [Mesorhizobium sp. LjNodule214]|uniref:hypothetical protein n=1 Tax=Mesorhizobium sp. LjNodule214 TaxID=3342252 RepID=UPI003ECCDBAF